MKLPKYLRVFTLSMLIVATVGAAFSATAISPSQAQSFSGTLVPSAGLVQVLPRNTTEWVNVKEKQLIHEGDQIRTGSDGVAHLSIVTGIAVDIYPTTVVVLDKLSMGDDSGEAFNLSQLVGTTYTDVSQTLRASDRVQITLPIAGVTVRGTQFFTFVSPDLNVGVIGQEHEVEVQTADNTKFTVTPDNLLYIEFKTLPSNADTLTCTAQFLKDNTTPRLVIDPLDSDTTKIQALREFLRALVRSNLNPQLRVFLRAFLGLPAVKLEGLSADDDEKELSETLSAIDALAVDNVKLSDFLTQYREFWAKTYKDSLTDALPPATCGNGKQDAGETAQTCPSDFGNPAACGNQVCETSRPDLAESVVSCPADCFPNGKLALSCAAVVQGIVNPPTPTPSGGASGVGR